jgi:hypothetical protein
MKKSLQENMIAQWNASLNPSGVYVPENAGWTVY